jgi:MutS domain V
MAGKSTVLRSTAAVALLAAAGLHAPARSASIPYIDAFMLRNFSADSPLEGKSSFAVEMTEMRCVNCFFGHKPAAQLASPAGLALSQLLLSFWPGWTHLAHPRMPSVHH